MEITLLILAVLISMVGLAGCIIPGLPGPPLNLGAVFLVQLAISPFSAFTLVVWSIVIGIVIVADYMLPVWTGKKFGATRQGITGSIIGMIMGMVIPPVGIILGLAAGAIIGDMIAGRKLSQSVKSGAGTVLGTLITMGMKLSVSGILTFMVIWNIITHYT